MGRWEWAVTPRRSSPRAAATCGCSASTWIPKRSHGAARVWLASASASCSRAPTSASRAAWPNRTHVGTRTFQALRMAVNDETGALRQTLHEIPQLLAAGGRLGVISFHSGEDRIVKQAFRALAAANFAELEPSPLTPGDDEVR